jgi:hypothetical protein
MFANDSLDGAISEVIVYHAATATEAFYESCYKHLVGAFRGRLDVVNKFAFRRAPVDKNYSSVHVVATLLGYHNKKTRPIKIEFQIRTALEDVWAEMDHMIFYKGLNIDSRDFALARSTMAQQKQHIDAISVTTDNIHSLWKAQNSDAGSDAFIRALGVEVSEERAGVRNAPERVKAAFRAITEELAGTYETIVRRLSESNPVLGHIEYNKLKNLCVRLEEFSEVTSGAPSVDKIKSYYFIKMEGGLANYWLAQISRGLAAAAFSGERSPIEIEERIQAEAWSTRESHHVAECISTYQELTVKAEYEADGFIGFRLGMAELELRGDAAAAARALDASVQRIALDGNIPSSSQFRIVIPRMLGFTLWREVEPTFRDRQTELTGNVLTNLQRAFVATYRLERLEVDDVMPRLRGYLAPEDESLKALNNWISYATYFLDSGGDIEALTAATAENAEPFSEDVFRTALDELYQRSGSDAKDRPWLLHTLTCAYRHMSDPSARIFAGALMRSLDAGFAQDEEPAWVERMRADAESAINDTGGE